MPHKALYGIIIVMYLRNKEHNPPHVHAITQDFDATFLIETGEIMEGEFPPKAKAMVKEFILKVRNELNQMWGTEKVVKLPPLDRFILRLSDEGSDTVFHKAVKVKFLDGTAMEVLFQDGKVKHYDMALLFDKYPQLKALQDHQFFLSGKLIGAYGIMWNDDLDIETETIYEDGITVREEKLPVSQAAGSAVASARAMSGLSQKQLAAVTGIDQSDISKIERGMANPSVATLERIAGALGGQLSIRIVFSENG